jgi:hypothetical protein
VNPTSLVAGCCEEGNELPLSLEGAVESLYQVRACHFLEVVTPQGCSFYYSVALQSDPNACPFVTACNRTYFGDVGRTYDLEIRRPREDRLPFLCHLNFTAGGKDLGDLVQVSVWLSESILVQVSVWLSESILVQVSVWLSESILVQVSVWLSESILVQVSMWLSPSRCKWVCDWVSPSRCRWVCEWVHLGASECVIESILVQVSVWLSESIRWRGLLACRRPQFVCV